MRKYTRKTVAVALGTVVLLSGAGAAFAYWTTTGTGTGAADNASSNGVVVLHAGFSAGLTPGGSKTVTYTADNAGTSTLFVGTITPTVSIDLGHPSCVVTDFTISPTLENATVAAGASGAALANTGTLNFANSGSNQDGCKGATVTLTLSSN